ncbi:hypothetical protein BHE74_00048328 [Ensete ventricosum]|nr:hypothetical protein BHE74_00048328 [Ensete ventricosum]
MGDGGGSQLGHSQAHLIPFLVRLQGKWPGEISHTRPPFPLFSIDLPAVPAHHTLPWLFFSGFCTFLGCLAAALSLSHHLIYMEVHVIPPIRLRGWVSQRSSIQRKGGLLCIGNTCPLSCPIISHRGWPRRSLKITAVADDDKLFVCVGAGIAPESKYGSENGEANGGMQREQKAVKEALISAYDRNVATRLKAELCAVDLNNHGYAREMANASTQWCTSWREQFTVLLSRGLKERRHEVFNKLRIFQVLSVATLGGLLWWHTPVSHIQDRTALIFFFSVFWGFFPLYNAVFTFPQERPMLRKEQAAGMYRLSSYFLARTAGDLPMELALPTAFTFIIYWMGGLDPHPLTFLLSLLVVLFSVLVAQSLGLAVGAILMDVKQATTLASVTTLVFLMAGGYYVQQIPPFIAWLKYLSYSFYCYKLLLGVQFTEHDSYECSKGVMCPVMEYQAIKSVGLRRMWVDVCVMAVMLVGYRMVAYLALRHLQHR